MSDRIEILADDRMLPDGMRIALYVAGGNLVVAVNLGGVCIARVSIPIGSVGKAHMDVPAPD